MSTTGDERKKSRIIELINGRFLDVRSGGYLDLDARVYIQGKKLLIQPGGDGSTDVKPDGAVDLGDRFVLPGLFNVHCHIQMVNPTLFSDLASVKARKNHHRDQVEKSMADCLARGITTIRDAYTNDLRPNRELKRRISRGDLPGPRILQAVVVGPWGGYLSPEIKGLKKILLKILGMSLLDFEDVHSGVSPFSPGADVGQVRAAVDRAVEERGADLIKVGESVETSVLNPDGVIMRFDQLEAVVDQARRRGLTSTIHSVSRDTFNRAVSAGFTSLAHMPRDERLSAEDRQACTSADCLLDPTLSVAYDLSWKLKDDAYENHSHLKRLYEFRHQTYRDIAGEFWVPELAPFVIKGFEKANRGKYKSLGLISLENMLKYYTRMAGPAAENVKDLVKDGASLALGNDGGIQACTPAMIGHELAVMDLFINNEEDRPFDAISQIRTATINSARSLGREKDFGSIESGKTADLVVYDQDPLENPAVIGSPAAAVFMDGELKVDKAGLGDKASAA